MFALEGVRSGYGRTEVVHGIDLTIADDGVTTVLGHNGAGKTTLLKTVMGLLPVRSGRITWDGKDITRMSAHQRVREGLAWVPQGQQSFGTLTTRENLLVVAEAHPGGRGRLEEVVAMFPALEPLMDRRAGLLSGGQRQQLSIARALLTGPRLLVLDEPSEGIQPSVVQEIEEKIVGLASRSGTQVLLAEQKVGFALDAADQYTVLATGRVVRSGRADEAAVDAAREALAV
ncbi:MULTISPECIES: ATP-binding cassette domain-containing protein [Kocuria]|uniref:ATP-binding cassette domain-containing protein n=1 Tax=Kocuria subflava TaxID=1736139 RepID=A0A846TT23_9MICC|nr:MULTISPECIES: ATP-binding cassette domain-containing protein [Kocuria]NKE10120.1 ATP-binding cassette domain-containing protein [Kocuria subflava]